MTGPFTDSELNHLLKFIGYGTLDADVWFLGMEEAGGGEANIQIRLKFALVEDNAEAHKMLGDTHLHWGRRKIQRTWRGMCYVMLRLEGQEPSKENIRTYQAEKLGRFGGNTLLSDLMPIPKPKVKRWDFEELIPPVRFQRGILPGRQAKKNRVFKGACHEAQAQCCCLLW